MSVGPKIPFSKESGIFLFHYSLLRRYCIYAKISLNKFIIYTNVVLNMNCKTVDKILSDTCYIRKSGTAEEKRCAEYLKSICVQMNLNAKFESFPIKMYDTKLAKLIIDGKEISCTGYWGAKSETLKAKLYYLCGTDELSLKKCKDKIVLVDGGVNFSLYDKLISNGAKGFITYNGSLFQDNRDIDQREIRFKTSKKDLIPAVNIHISDAFEIVKDKGEFAEIVLEQTEYIGESYNVILDLEGESDETLIISAHYDSTSLSTGAYDNMSSCIGLLYLAEYFSKVPHRCRIRLLWCGGEERGLLGSHAYCSAHKDELKNTLLNINLDMLGSVMGEFVAFSCVNEEMADFLVSFLKRHRFTASVRHTIRSSDSTAFNYYNVPAVSFARYAPSGTGSIHTRFDTAKMVSSKQLLTDMKIIAKFTEYIANEINLPMSMDISDKIKSEVEKYMQRSLSAVEG